MDRLTKEKQESLIQAWFMNWRDAFADSPENERELAWIRDLALQSLSLESVRSEELEELRRLVKLLADLSVTESEIEQEFKYGPRVIFEKGGKIAVRDVLMARRALQSSARVAEGEQGARRKGKYRLVYNKATQKIDKVSNLDGLVAESFDPPLECDVHSTELRK